MTDAAQSALGARVDSLERNHVELKEGLDGLEKKVDRGFAEFGRELRSSVAMISDKVGKSRETNWVPLLTAIGLAVTVLGAYGALAVAPLVADTTRLQKSVDLINARFVDEQRRRIDRLELENRMLRMGGKP